MVVYSCDRLSDHIWADFVSQCLMAVNKDTAVQPQGSILGPLLFTVYINDLPSCNLFSKPRMYADDTTLTSSAEDPYSLEHKMNCDMNLIQSWLTANKLTLNVKKTKYILIGNNFKLSQIHDDFTVKVHYTTREGKQTQISWSLH